MCGPSAQGVARHVGRAQGQRLLPGPHPEPTAGQRRPAWPAACPCAVSGRTGRPTATVCRPSGHTARRHPLCAGPGLRAPGSGLRAPGSRLQAASENLWLEKVLASPILASPSLTLPGLSRSWVSSPLSTEPSPAAACPPGPLSRSRQSPSAPPSLPTDLAYPGRSHFKLQIKSILLSSP